MSDVLRRKPAGPAPWRHQAVGFQQGVTVLLLIGVVVLGVGVVALFAGRDGGATAAALVSGTLLTGLAAVLFSLAAPRYVGTASIVAETLFDYTDAKARLAALELADEAREPFRRLARGEAAQAYLDLVLRNLEVPGEGAGEDGAPSTATTVRLDPDRIASDAVDRARNALRPVAEAVGQRGPTGQLRGHGTPAPPPSQSDTIDQPFPPAAG